MNAQVRAMNSTQTACASRCDAESCICISLNCSGKKSAGDYIGISNTIDESISNADAKTIALSVCFSNREFLPIETKNAIGPAPNAFLISDLPGDDMA